VNSLAGDCLVDFDRPEMKMKKQSLRAEKEFGLIVGGVMALVGAWWLYRGKFTSVAHVALPLGVVLMVMGLAIPRALKLPNRLWMRFAELLSFVTTRIILAFVFFVVITPIGLVKRALGWDPLHRRASGGDSYWHAYSERQLNPRHYEKMF
jgi:hypothetical protein